MGNRRRILALPLLLVLLAATTAVPAQRLGPPALPAAALQRPLPPALERLPDTARAPLHGLADRVEGAVDGRAAQLLQHVQRHPAVLDVDAAGAPVVRGEVVAIDPSEATLARAREAGFQITREHVLESLGLRVVVLRAARGVDTHQALDTLRRIDPDGQYDYNHVYLGAGAVAAGGPAAPPDQASPGTASGFRVGLVDSGVAAGHPALSGVRVQRWGCGGKAVPAGHGTAVASLLAGSSGGTGSAGTLYAADIYCGQPVGGAVTGYAAALEWMAREDVPVVNLSMVGPDNALLRKATLAMVERGHLLVAAVGNDGPAAAPLYPAAYPGVVGVTAVDGRERVLPEAGRGRHVLLAAPGKHERVARPDGGWGRVRGTSYAAPLVARAAAMQLQQPGRDAAERTRAALVAQAVDLGDRGRDDTYGHGLLDPGPMLARGADR